MPKSTYRYDEIKKQQIKAFLTTIGESFQGWIDTIMNETLFKMKYETPYFKDVPNRKKAQYIITDVLADIPITRNFFKKKA